MAATIVASSVSFGVYFIVAGAVFLDVYQVPSYTFKDWQLLAGIGLGLCSAVVAPLLGVVMRLAKGIFGRSRCRRRSATDRGLVFGVVGVILPLTMFTGSDQLKIVLATGGTLGSASGRAAGGKILTFAVSEASGFVGGPIFPALFIGGTAGVPMHQVSRPAARSGVDVHAGRRSRRLGRAPFRWCCWRRS